MTEEELRVPRIVKEALDTLGISRGESVGVAVSGGADSVALLLALRQAGMLCTALHCNFGLRAQESEDDEMYVRGLCDSIGVPLETVRFDVAARRAQTGESEEMACRELRYDWFADRAKALGLKYVALGHHLEDDVETFFLNLLRGTGLPGVSGMAQRRGIYIRPMLRCTRADIEAYLHGKRVGYVTDSSNLSENYGRNRLRLRVLPELVKAEPDALEKIGRSMGYLHDDLTLLRGLLDMKRSEFIDSEGKVDVQGILSEPAPEHLLFRLLLPLYPGLKSSVAASVIEAARRGESGKIFDAGECRLLLDRGSLYPYREVRPQESVAVDLRNPSATCRWLHSKMIPVAEFRPGRDLDVMWMDAAALDRGLTFIVRAPRIGDRMAPFGMKGTKLLSDIFRDARLSEADKERVSVLTAVDPASGAETILWVPGLRASRHFAVIPATDRVLRLQWKKP